MTQRNHITKMIQATLALVALAMPALASAGEAHLFYVGGEGQKGWTSVKIVTDDAGNLTGLKVGNAPVPKEKILSSDGAPIPIEGVDRTVMKLAGPGLDLSSGGDITLNYLHDGITNGWDKLKLSIHKDDKGAWKVYKRGQSNPLRSLYFTQNTFFGKTIGIDEVRIGTNVRRNVVDSSNPNAVPRTDFAALEPARSGEDPAVADGRDAGTHLPALPVGGLQQSDAGVPIVNAAI